MTKYHVLLKQTAFACLGLPKKRPWTNNEQNLVSLCYRLRHKNLTSFFIRDKRFSSLFVQKWCFSCFERDFSKYFSANIFYFGANFQNLFQIQLFPHFSYTQKIKTTSPLPTIYYDCTYINTRWAKPSKAGFCDNQWQGLICC